MKKLAVLLLVFGCGDDPIQVRHDNGGEYNRTELDAAIGKFVTAGRTPAAYGVMAREVVALRSGMDETVAELAELELVTLAIDPVESVRGLPRPAQTAALATTVWPIALAPPFDALAADGWRDPREAPVALHEGEDALGYLRRMCEEPYAVVCKHVVPEWQGDVLGTEAVSRMTQRVRAAVANCEECTDAAWHRTVARWEQLDHAASQDRRHFETEGATARWPVAGPGAEPADHTLAVLEVEPDGDWIYDGERLDLDDRASVLADVVASVGGPDAVIEVHLRPDARVETLAQILTTAAAAGFAEVRLEARADVYPWELRSYHIPTAKKPQLGRASDTLQVYLRGKDPKVIDGVAEPALPR